MSIPLDVEWVRLGQGKVRHAALPDWLHSVGSMGGPHRWTLCGRTGVPNTAPYVYPLQGGGMRQADPAKFGPCTHCLKAAKALVERAQPRRQ